MSKFDNLIKALNDLATEENADVAAQEAAEKEKAEKAAAAAAAAKGVSIDVDQVVDKLFTKLTTAIAEKKNLGGEDTKNLGRLMRMNAAGVLEPIAYPADLKSLSKEDKIKTFFKALVLSKSDFESQQVLKALVEGTDSQGGYLVPEELRSEIFRVLPDFAVMRKIARVIPMATDTLKLNSLAARPVAYWTAEYASKSTTSASFSQVTLSPNDLVCLLPVTHQLLADANINMVQFITELFAEAIAMAEDCAFFTGSGTGRPKGINQESLTSVATGGAMTFDHVHSLLYSVPQRVRMSPRAAFVAHQRVIKLLRLLKDSQNRYIWEPSVQVGQPERILGYPIYEQNDLAQSELYFGDWSYYIIGDRQQVIVSTTNEGGEAWRRNSMEIKAVERVDGKTVLTKAFAKATGIN